VGHQRPFFAPTAAVVTLGLTVGQRRRRAVEIGLGVALGVFVGDLLVSGIGSGTWQIALVTGLAMVVATALGGGPLVASQAAISAVLVCTIQVPSHGFHFSRFVDAAVGSGVALLVGSLFFPVDPISLVRASAEPLLQRLAAALEQIADALEARDLGAAERALVATSAIEPEHDSLESALAAGLDTARLAPVRRTARGRLQRYSLVAHEIGLAPANVRVLARHARHHARGLHARGAAHRTARAGKCVPCTRALPRGRPARRRARTRASGSRPGERGAQGDLEPVGAPPGGPAAADRRGHAARDRPHPPGGAGSRAGA